jgi:MoaA/NifB/PqqE/SkfB family radical SAM enzyme
MDVNFENFGVLQIEPTDQCNLKCKMCTPHAEGFKTIHGVPKGSMDLELYREIIDGLARDGAKFDHIIFQWLGDPSLHPNLEEMIGYAMEKMAGLVGYLRIDTNAIILTPERMDRLVALYERHKEVPLLVVFTLDAVTPETYKVVKGADHLERVRRNIRHFIRARAALPFDDVRLNIQLQFVLQGGNSHEAGEFVEYWQHTLRCLGGGKGHNEIMVKRLSVGAGGPGQLAADQLYEETVAKLGLVSGGDDAAALCLWESRPWESTSEHSGGRQACPGLWITPVIRHDGLLMMCCVDLQGELDLGSLGESSFMDLWHSPKAESVRLSHIKGEFSKHSPCGDCGGINWYNTPNDFVEKWLEQRGKGELMDGYVKRLEGR